MSNALTPDVIRQQREAAENDIRAAEAVIAGARQRISDLDAALRVLESLIGDPARVYSDLVIDGRISGDREMPVRIHAFPATILGDRKRTNPFRSNTNKAFIWEVLATASPPWLNAQQIKEAASDLKGEEIPMSSISPSLSDMKMKDDVLERRGMLVALKSRLHENGAPEGAPDAEEVAPSSIENQSGEGLLG